MPSAGRGVTKELKQALYERIQLPGSKVFDGRERIGLIKFPNGWLINIKQTLKHLCPY
jgi:hypothetical protein